MPFQWYLFYHTYPDICLEVAPAASGEAVQLCWCILGDRDPAVRLVLLNIWPQPVFCKREENWGKILKIILEDNLQKPGIILRTSWRTLSIYFAARPSDFCI